MDYFLFLDMGVKCREFMGKEEEWGVWGLEVDGKWCGNGLKEKMS